MKGKKTNLSDFFYFILLIIWQWGKKLKIAYSCFRLHEDYFSYPMENKYFNKTKYLDHFSSIENAS